MNPPSFFWLHIKKAGGQSFRRTFTPPYIQTDRSDTNCKPFIALPKEKWNDALNNYRIPLGEYDFKRMLFAKKFLYSEDEFNSMFKFVIVRNPYDRAVSCWKYLTDGKSQFQNHWRNPRRIFSKPGFFEFLNQLPHIWESKKDRHVCTHTAAIWPDITDENNVLLVDKIIKLEEISEEINFVNQKLGTSIDTFNHTNKSRPNDNYRKYYTAKSRALVEKFYREDIKNLGYSF